MNPGVIGSGEPAVLITMPGTGLPLAYQLSDAKERAELRYEGRQSTKRQDNQDVTEEQDTERVTNVIQFLGQCKPGLPLPRELLDANTALVQSISAHICFIQLLVSDWSNLNYQR